MGSNPINRSMTKVCICWWHGSNEEESAITECGYLINEFFETEEDLYSIINKLYLKGVTVILHKYSGTISDPPTHYISVCDQVRPGQR
jgi:hypothetical protein